MTVHRQTAERCAWSEGVLRTLAVEATLDEPARLRLQAILVLDPAHSEVCLRRLAFYSMPPRTSTSACVARTSLQYYFALSADAALYNKRDVIRGHAFKACRAGNTGTQTTPE